MQFFVSKGRLRRLAACAMGLLLFAAGAPAAFAGSPISVSQAPKADPSPADRILAGKPVTFTAGAHFTPPEKDGTPWAGFVWNFGDGTATVNSGRIDGNNPRHEVEHTFPAGGEFTVAVTAYHGFDLFGYRFTATKNVKVKVLPKLPLVVGVFSINGDNLEVVGKEEDQKFKISGNVVINGIMHLSNAVTADLANKEVEIGGALSIPVAGPYADIFSTAKNLTFDANTGLPKSTELDGVEAKFEIAKFQIEFTNFKIDTGGVEFDFLFKAPRLVKGDDNGKDLIKLEFKKFRVDAVSPYLHTLGDTTLTVSNLKIQGTDYGIDTMQIGYGFGPPEKYFGGITFSLPSDRTVGGEIEILEGQLNKLSFTAGVKIPIYTLTGVGDAIYLTSINAQVRNLAVVEGAEPQEPTIAAGELDPGSLDVTTPGITLEWGVGIPIAEGLEVTAVTVDGAAEFTSRWDLTVGGELTFFKEKFGTRFRMAQVRGSYRHDSSTITLQGRLSYDNLFALEGSVATRFDEFDYYHTAVATGTVTLPEDHWARRFVPSGTCEGTAVLILRAAPTEKYLAGFRGKADVRILGERTLGFQIDLSTGELSTEFDADIVALLPAKAESRSAALTGGQGADGLVVRLKHATGTANFNLRLPDGSLLTPASANGTTIDYGPGSAPATEAVYILATAPNGTYTAEFDDTGLGSFEVSFLTPQPAPTVVVSAPGAAVSVGKYDVLPVSLAVEGLVPSTPVRAYLDEDGVAGGGHLIASGTQLSTALDGIVRDVPPGTYRVVVEADPVGEIPVAGTSAGVVTVREYASVDLVIKKGSVKNDAKPAKDTFSATGTIAFNADSPDDAFNPATDALELRLGSAADPLVVSVPAGHAGWKTKKSQHTWKGSIGVKGKVTVVLDPVKHKLSVKVTGADLGATPANPLGLELIFGNDRGVVRGTWRQRAPGYLTLP